VTLNVRPLHAGPADRDYGLENRGHFGATGLIGYQTGEHDFHRTRVAAYAAAAVGAFAEFVKDPFGRRRAAAAAEAGALVTAVEATRATATETVATRPATLADAAAQYALERGNPADTMGTLLQNPVNDWQQGHVAAVRAALAASVVPGTES